MQNFQEIIKRLSKPIYKILINSPEGVTEYDLIKKLEETNLIEKGHWENQLELFQRHFILFHALYHIKSYLDKKKRKNLKISCMEIKILPRIEFDTNGLSDYDALESYYLDPNNLF